MPYSTQFHFVVPSPGRAVITSANSRVPAGAFDQDSAMVGIGTARRVRRRIP